MRATWKNKCVDHSFFFFNGVFCKILGTRYWIFFIYPILKEASFVAEQVLRSVHKIHRRSKSKPWSWGSLCEGWTRDLTRDTRDKVGSNLFQRAKSQYIKGLDIFYRHVFWSSGKIKSLDLQSSSQRRRHWSEWEVQSACFVRVRVRVCVSVYSCCTRCMKIRKLTAALPGKPLSLFSASSSLPSFLYSVTLFFLFYLLLLPSIHSVFQVIVAHFLLYQDRVTRGHLDDRIRNQPCFSSYRQHVPLIAQCDVCCCTPPVVWCLYTPTVSLTINNRPERKKTKDFLWCNEDSSHRIYFPWRVRCENRWVAEVGGHRAVVCRLTDTVELSPGC